MKNRTSEGAASASGWCHYKMPSSVAARFAHEPLVADFLITHLGFYPRSSGHEAWRPHPLPEAIFILCLTGRGWVMDLRLQDMPRQAVDPGEAMLLAPGVPHYYAADESDPWSIIWFHFAGPRGCQFAERLVAAAPGIVKGPVTCLWELHDRIQRMIDLRSKGWSRAVLLESNALGESVLARLYSDAVLTPIQPADIGSMKGAENRAAMLRRVLDHLRVNFAQELTVADVARACHVSTSWLAHAFPEHTGFSPLKHAIHLRLQEACRLLALTDRKVADVAAAVGYKDAFYFSRLFKKHIGLSPDSYRRQYSR